MTFVASYGSTVFDSSSTTKTASVTVANGDTLVVWALSQQNTTTFTTPTGGTGFSWTQQFNNSAGTGHAGVAVWTTTATSAQTFTLSVTFSSATNEWAMGVERHSAVSVGAVASTAAGGSAPSLALTTTAASSAIVMVLGDFNGIDGTTRTYRTGAGAFTEHFYSNITGGVITGYAGYHANAGTAGAKTLGLTAPTGQSPTMVAVELAPAGATVTPNSITTGEVDPSPTITMVTPTAPSSITSGAVVPSPTVTTILSVSPSSISSGEVDPSPTITNVLTVTPTSITSAQVVNNPGVSLGPATQILAPVSITSSASVPSAGIVYGLQILTPLSITTSESQSPDHKATLQVPIKVFIPPFVQRRVPINLGGFAALMNFGLAVYRINGVWHENEYPPAQDLDAADLYFPGGHINPIDDATAAILAAAGYETSEVFFL